MQLIKVKMKKARKNYNREFKISAVFLSYQNGNLAQTSRELQIGKNLLFLWRKEFKKYGSASFPGNGNPILSSDEKKINNLEKIIKENEMCFELIKSAGKCVTAGRESLFCFMVENEKKYTIKLMCRTLGLNRGTYRVWKRGLPLENQRRRIDLKKEISSIFAASKETYGCHRIAAELKRSGVEVSHTTVLKCMRELGLRVPIKKT